MRRHIIILGILILAMTTSSASAFHNRPKLDSAGCRKKHRASAEAACPPSSTQCRFHKLVDERIALRGKDCRRHFGCYQNNTDAHIRDLGNQIKAHESETERLMQKTAELDRITAKMQQVAPAPAKKEMSPGLKSRIDAVLRD